MYAGFFNYSIRSNLTSVNDFIILILDTWFKIRNNDDGAYNESIYLPVLFKFEEI